MSIRAKRCDNGTIYLEIVTLPPSEEVIGKDGKAILSTYFTKEQWDKLLTLDNTDVLEEVS